MHDTCHITYHHPFFRYRRRFLSEEEKEELKRQHRENKIKWIENYKRSLEAELKAVNEHLEEMKKRTA